MNSPRRSTRWARRVGIEVLGWGLVILGLAALVLPGPGLLALAAGLVILSQQYEWAERRLEPVKEKAFEVAEDGVRTWPRILMSCAGALWLIGIGIVWILQPAVPAWWPIDDRWWFPGGWGTGSSLVFSGLIAFALIIYSIRRFRPATS